MKKILLIFSMFLLLLTPGLILAALVECGDTSACTIDDFLGILPKIVNIIIFDIVPPAAILFLTIGGIVLLVSAGNPGLKTLGRNILVSTVIGMALVYGAWLIINFILTTLGATPLSG